MRLAAFEIGSRVVAAIRLDAVETGGTDGTHTLSQQAAKAAGWFHGPPYAIAETVFDEDDQESCEPVSVGGWDQEERGLAGNDLELASVHHDQPGSAPDSQ